MWYTAGGPTAQALHRTVSSSQSSIARFGGLLDTLINAVDSFHAISALSHLPKQVLFPPVTKTIHSSIPGLAVAAPGLRMSLKLPTLKRSTFAAATLFAPDAIGFGILTDDGAEGIAEEIVLLACANQPLTWSRNGNCCAVASAGSASSKCEVRMSKVSTSERRWTCYRRLMTLVIEINRRVEIKDLWTSARAETCGHLTDSMEEREFSGMAKILPWKRRRLIKRPLGLQAVQSKSPHVEPNPRSSSAPSLRQPPEKPPNLKSVHLAPRWNR